MIKHWAPRLAAVSIASLAMVGCDESASKSATPASTDSTVADGQRKAADTLAEGQRKAAEVTADAQKKAADEMADANAKAAADARKTAENVGEKAQDAANTLVAQAQKLYDQAREAINKADVPAAQQYVDQLSALRDKLPADWQTKVDELTKLLSDAKSKLNGLTVPKLN